MACLRASLDAAGIDVFASQAEHGLGQWEINLDYCPALEMADRHVVYKEGAKELALREGLSLTFMALPVADEIGPLATCTARWLARRHAGLRRRAGRPALVADGARVPGRLDGPPRRDRASRSLRELLQAPRRAVLGCGQRLGRRQPHTLLPGGRVRPVVADRASLPRRRRQPYLAIAAVIAAGLDGIDRGLDPGAPVVGNAYEYGELPRPPASLGQAIDVFERSEFGPDAFGKEAIRNLAFRTHGTNGRPICET